MWRWPVPALMLIVVASCSGADSGPVFTADEVRSPTSTPTPSTQLVVPLTTVPPAETASGAIVFNLLSSPEPGVAEIAGVGAVSTDTITIDGANSAFLSFENTADGGFIATVSITAEREHIICIADTCGVLDLPG